MNDTNQVLRKKIFKIFFISFGLLALSFVILSPSLFGLCVAGDRYCFDPYDDIIGQPVGTFALVVAILSLMLLIFPRAFASWLRFAKYYLPISAGLLFLFPVTDGSITGFDLELMTWFFAGAFFAISIILIIYKQLRAKAT